MSEKLSPQKRRILFEFHEIQIDEKDSIQINASEKKIDKLKQLGVGTIFIIGSNNKNLYDDQIDKFKKSEFDVKIIDSKILDEKKFIILKEIVNEINTSFKKNSCLIISSKNSNAGIIIASFFVFTGKNSEEAIAKVNKIKEGMIKNDEDILYINSFESFLLEKDDEVIIDASNEQIIKDDYIPESTYEETIHYEDKKKQQHEHDERDDLKQLLAPDQENIQIEKKSKLNLNMIFTSLRIKLITIISLIIFISLTVMIFLASHFFLEDNKLRVEGNNSKLSQVIALKVKSDFSSIVNRSRLISTALDKKDKENSIINQFWENEKEILFIGIAVKDNKLGMDLVETSYNKKLMNDSGITVSQVYKVNNNVGSLFNKSFFGIPVIHNVSPGFNLPIMAISFPVNKTRGGNADKIFIIYLKLHRILQAFQSDGLTNAFMVNENGEVIAHTDSSIVLANDNYIDLSIVKMMRESNLNHGQTQYINKNDKSFLGSFTKIGIAGSGIIATINEVKAFQEVYNIRRRNIYLMIIILTIVILIVYFFGKTITTPILRLVNATLKIGEGNYNIDIRPTSRDEIGTLTRSFIKMGKGLEEREKIKTAFGKFVNPDIAEMVVKDEVQLGGERKDVAVFFSDIRSFTAMSEKLEPEEVVDFLNKYMTRMVDCINKTDGVVDKFIGDAIMAIWGVPVTTGNDTENAIDAALLMRKSLFEFNKERDLLNKPSIQIGCGINTGPVLAGQIGSEDRMEYTVIGDTVNLGSRIEALNKPFGTDILISEDSYAIVKGIYNVEKMSPIKVKGKEEEQQIYAVIGRVNDKDDPETITELRKLLGTTAEPFKRRRNDTGENEVKYEILK